MLKTVATVARPAASARGGRPVDVFWLVRLPAGHLALRACAVEAAGASALEEVGRQFLDHAAHLPGERPDLPLRAIAAAHLEEVAQLARVHGDDDLGLGGVGEHEARVFLHALAGPALGEAQLDQPVVGHAGLLHGLEKHRLGLGGLADTEGGTTKLSPAPKFTYRCDCWL